MKRTLRELSALTDLQKVVLLGLLGLGLVIEHWLARLAYATAP